MATIDRLGWADGLAFTSHGARIGIRVNEPPVLERVREYLPPGSRLASSPSVDALYSLVVGGSTAHSHLRRFHLLYVGAGQLARTMELQQVFDALEASLYVHVPVFARRRLFVQAGVVGWHGSALLILGRRGSGTSALVAAFVKAGATHYSDEYAAFDRRGRVHPYGGPLSLDGERGGRDGRAPLRVGAIISTEYKAGARWRPRVLSPAQAVLRLLARSRFGRVEPAFALEALGRAASDAIALEGRRDEAVSVTPLLVKQLQVSLPRKSVAERHSA